MPVGILGTPLKPCPVPPELSDEMIKNSQKIHDKQNNELPAVNRNRKNSEPLNYAYVPSSFKGGLRSLTKSFLFISQNRNTSFAAESCIEVLRVANILNCNALYTWSHKVADNRNFDFTECDPNQTIVLAGGIFDPWLPSNPTCGKIRTPLRTAARVCVIGSAIFVPLCAGILKTQRAAVHPHFRAAVKERGYINDFYDGTVCHQPLLSSAVSPLAAVEMIIELIGAQDGTFIETAIKDQLGLVSDLSMTRSREYWHFKHMGQGNTVVSQALDIMLENLEDTLSIGQISRSMEVSTRRVERNFREKINLSPLQVYRSLQLEKVEKLLSQTDLPISEISIACGFYNTALLTKWYKRKFGVQPSLARRFAYIGKSAA